MSYRTLMLLPDATAVQAAGADVAPGRARRRRAARATTTVAAGALALALTATGTAATWAPATKSAADQLAVLLTSNEFQAQLDHIFASQQQIIANNSAYPWADSFDASRLPQYVQNLSVNGVMIRLFEYNLDHGYEQNGAYMPYATTAHGADPQWGVNQWNPDQPYFFPHIGSQTETLTVHPGPGAENLTFTPSQGDGAEGGLTPITSIEINSFTPNADGSYTITLSPTDPGPGVNWIDTTGADSMLVRPTTGDWGLLHDTLTLTPDSSPSIVPVLSHGDIAGFLQGVADTIPGNNLQPVAYGIQHFIATLPPNHFTPIGSTPGLIGPALLTQQSSFAHVELQPDQALVVKVPTIDAAYAGFQVSNTWTIDLPEVTAQGSLNNTQVFHDPDGYTYYVMSNYDPGVANWIDTSDTPNVDVMMRWMDIAQGQDTTQPITAQVVPLADVTQNVPSDMPLVTPAERAADVQARTLEWGYLHDQFVNNAGWITQNLENDQIEQAIGSTAYDHLFGSQIDVPSVLDRMTDSSLIPDASTLMHAIMTNDPGDTMSAWVQNLPLLIGDIGRPMVLAAVQFDMMQAGAPYADTMSAWLEHTFSDPTTSITAGLLNARDDLWVALTNADSYSALTAADMSWVSDQLSTLGQSFAQALEEGMQLLTTP